MLQKFKTPDEIIAEVEHWVKDDFQNRTSYFIPSLLRRGCLYEK